MNENKQFEKDGFIFEVDSNESNAVTILNQTGVFGHVTCYFNNTPVIANEKVICIPESVVDDTARKYVVTSISRGVFDSLTKVEEIYIPATIKNIAWSFWQCINLKKIHVDPDNQYYKDVDGVLYSKDLKRLVVFPCNYSKFYKVLNGVVEIANMAFKSSSFIEEIELPNTLKKIGINVFYGCVNLKQVYEIPDGLTTFESNKSNKSIIAIFHYKNREWSLQEIVQEFEKNKTHLLK